MYAESLVTKLEADGTVNVKCGSPWYAQAS